MFKEQVFIKITKNLPRDARTLILFPVAIHDCGDFV